MVKDIEDVDPDEIPRSDLMIGGFPCQGFSCANRLRSPSDSRNELYRHFVRILGETRPTYFLAENVRGILSLDEGRVIKMIIEDFSEIGYDVGYRLVNAADYGVPQNRWRVFIVGVRRDSGMARPEFPPATHSRKPDLMLEPWVSIGQALEGIPEPNGRELLLNHVGSKYKVTNRNFTGHRRTDPEKPSPTILARGNGKGGVCAIQHPNNHRRLTVRESAIVQTFPLDFEFFGKLGSMYRQIGNAVPVRLAARIGEAFAL